MRLQLLVPRKFQKGMFQLTHAILFRGHLGREKTLDRVTMWFYWLGAHLKVRDFHASCPECQCTGQEKVPKSPLVPLPIIRLLFERIGVDLVVRKV